MPLVRPKKALMHLIWAIQTKRYREHLLAHSEQGIDAGCAVPADNAPDSAWAAAGSDHSPSWHDRPVQVHSQQLHAHCNLQDGLLLLLSACGMRHAHSWYQPACCFPDRQGDPVDYGAVLSGMISCQSNVCREISKLRKVNFLSC